MAAMTTYRLVVLPDGHALLTSPGPMGEAEHARLVEGFTRWRAQPPGTTMILPDTDVVQVVDVQLGGLMPHELAADGGMVTPAAIDRAAFGLSPLEVPDGTPE